jgi:AcrR family transcriptional regulator
MSRGPPLTSGPPRVRYGWSGTAHAITFTGSTPTSGGISNITPMARRKSCLIRVGHSRNIRSFHRDAGYRDAVADTRQRLIEGAIETIRTHGLAGTSARSIATAAGVNQALVFYHFGSVHDLLKAACLTATQARVTSFAQRLDQTTDVRQLLALGRAMHTEERAQGNVMVLAQMLAGAQADPRLAEATAAALQLWITPIEHALTRLLAGSPVAELIDTASLARAVSAGFVGLELYEGVDPDGARAALDALDRLAVLIEVMDDLGPVARRALHGKLRRTTKNAR